MADPNELHTAPVKLCDKHLGHARMECLECKDELKAENAKLREERMYTHPTDPNPRTWKDEAHRLFAQVERLTEASRPVLMALQAWLDDDECDCDVLHVCGRTDRQRELDALAAALATKPEPTQ